MGNQIGLGKFLGENIFRLGRKWPFGEAFSLAGCEAPIILFRPLYSSPFTPNFTAPLRAQIFGLLTRTQRYTHTARGKAIQGKGKITHSFTPSLF